VIQTRVHEEGTPNVNIATTPNGSFAVTFTPLGAVTTNADGTATVTRMDFVNPSGGACQTDSPAGAMRCLRIVVSGGGSVRMCDPQLTALGMTTDPRACP
jgi:type IV fimbrial biogenesis protein FimT